jgi:hypothetical protein
VNIGAKIDHIRGYIEEIEEIESLLVNLGSKCINSKLKTQIKTSANLKADI